MTLVTTATTAFFFLTLRTPDNLDSNNDSNNADGNSNDKDTVYDPP
jgi:hypothetical protein